MSEPEACRGASPHLSRPLNIQCPPNARHRPRIPNPHVPNNRRLLWIYSMALVASYVVLRMLSKLCCSDSLAKMQFRRFLHLLQRRRVWATVLRRSPQLQQELVMSGAYKSGRESSRPIFSVRSCIGSALCHLMSFRGVATPPWWVWTCVCCVVFFVIPPCASSLPLCLRLAPTSQCLSEWI
ncbi:hypothetical protein IG631_05506 [Alternaria alternata]|nr:hypothetical protein IG631_05506 [Alternaria alternata]